jgi:hypothetical protein
MRKLISVALTVLVVAVLAAPASGATAADPNDSDGILDVQKIASAYDSSTGVLTLKLRTFHGWGCRYLRQGVKTSLNWYLDDGEDGDNDLTGKFVCVNANKDPQLIFKLHGNDSDNRYESLKATRPNHHTVKVKMPTDLTELESDHVSVHARSTDAINEGCDPACTDRAPDTGGMRVY